MDLPNPPPCLVVLGMNGCNRGKYEWEVRGNGPLHGLWTGWRIVHDEIVSPEGDRMRLNRLRWLMREQWLHRKKPEAAGVLRLRPAAGGCARPAASALPTPPDGGGPVAPAGAALPPPLRGTGSGG